MTRSREVSASESQTINTVGLLATGVDGDGHREVLGMRVATSETAAAWNEFFADWSPVA